MFDEYTLANYIYGLNVVGAIVAVAILISSLDDLFIDVYYWSRELYRKIFVNPNIKPLQLEQLREKKQSYLAIMVPAWKEYAVVAQMVESNTTSLEYDNYKIFIGTYPNDAETTAEADRMVRRFPGRVHRATVPHPGPTNKSDCLNAIMADIFDYEKTHDIEFSGYILHDCEDVIHPLELHLFNYLIDRKDMIQVPIFSLERKWHEFVGSTYLDDFGEWCEKEMVVRESLTGIVPGSGVATCYSRHAISLLAEDGQDPFNITTLTEDYDMSYRLDKLGASMIFVKVPVTYTARRKDFLTRREVDVHVESLICTREYFPDTFRAAYRQRARWLIGVAFQGWQQLGWSGSLSHKYLLFRDRKSVVTSFITLLAYFLVLNLFSLAFLRWAGYDYIRFPELTQPDSWIFTVYMINFWFFANRLFQRSFFVTKMYGIEQGLLSILRFPLGNVINLFSLTRAWRIFLGHLITGKPIAWDKTRHDFPIDEQSLAATRKKLGEILIAWHELDDIQLNKTLSMQAESGKKLGELLVDLEFISDETLADAMSEQSGLRRANITHKNTAAFSEILPLSIVKKHRAVPFAEGEGGSLNIGIAAELDEQAIEEIQQYSKRKVDFFIVLESEISAILDHKITAPASNRAPQHRLLGDILVSNGVITFDQLTDALNDYAPERDGKIGAFLVTKQSVTSEQLDHALKLQQQESQSSQSGKEPGESYALET